MASHRTIVFDLDGTLVHSLPGLTLSLNRVLADRDREPLEDVDVRAMIGEGVRKLVERGLQARGVPSHLDEALTRFLQHYAADALSHTQLFPGAREALDALAHDGARLALCTNKPQTPTLAILDRLDLAGRFEAVVGGDLLDVHKPDPRHILETIRRAGADPAATVYVGDSPADAQAAHGAGLPLVLMRHGYTRVPVDQLGAELVLDHLNELPPALRERGWL